MLLGFLGCAGAKAYYALAGITPPIYLDAFFIGIVLSILGAVAGSLIFKVSPREQQLRQALFDSSIAEDGDEECRKDRRMWLVYLAFAIFVGCFFLFMYALPYNRALV